MKYYVFYDTNVFGDCSEELDITSENYKKLLMLCFKYSTSLSFMISGEGIRTIVESLPKKLDEYRIDEDDNVLDVYMRYMDGYKDIRCYTACPETYDLVLGINDSLFKWINGRGNKKPEDLTFYRKDGSVFFSSVIHEGECFLYPRDNEDVSSVVSNGKWYLVDPTIKSITPAVNETGDSPMSSDKTKE